MVDVTNLKLSVVIHTKNAGATLKATLESVKFADEIIVVDMHSRDQTLKIAKRYTKKVFQHEDLGYADPARNFGLSKAGSPWILVLDADEQLTPELQTIITETISLANAADVYYLPRKNLVFDKWLLKTGWWPDYQPRLFKKGMVSWQVGVHRLPDIKGNTEYFPAEERYALVHNNYESLEQFLAKLNTYTSLQAKERAAQTPQTVFSAEQLMETFAGEFAKRSLALDGVEDGLHGVSLSLLQAMYEATIYLKQWQASGFHQTSPEDFGQLLNKFQSIWRYWWADYQVRHTNGWENLYWRLRRRLKK